VLPVAGTLEARACILPGMRAAVLLMICAAVAAVGCRRPAAPGKPRPPASTPVLARVAPPLPVWRVVSVHDGDTLRAIDQANVQHKIRLAGIDAPELGQPFGRASRDRLAELTQGQVVTVYIDSRHRYGRTVARLEADGLDVCRQLVADRLAWHYTRYSDDAALAAAEREARADGRGLWRDPQPVPPWEWRAGERERKAALRQPSAR